MVNNQLDRVEKATTKEDAKQELMNMNYTIGVFWLCCPCHGCLSWQTCICPVLGIGLSHLFTQVTYACTDFSHVTHCGVTSLI